MADVSCPVTLRSIVRVLLHHTSDKSILIYIRPVFTALLTS